MTASARRPARLDAALVLALPARAERRPAVVVLEPARGGRAPVPVEDEWWAPAVLPAVDPYGAPAPRPGLLVDVYG